MRFLIYSVTVLLILSCSACYLSTDFGTENALIALDSKYPELKIRQERENYQLKRKLTVYNGKAKMDSSATEMQLFDNGDQSRIVVLSNDKSTYAVPLPIIIYADINHPTTIPKDKRDSLFETELNIALDKLGATDVYARQSMISDLFAALLRSQLLTANDSSAVEHQTTTWTDSLNKKPCLSLYTDIKKYETYRDYEYAYFLQIISEERQGKIYNRIRIYHSPGVFKPIYL